MNRHKFILFMAAAIACVGCCALPLYAVVAGVISFMVTTRGDWAPVCKAGATAATPGESDQTY